MKERTPLIAGNWKMHHGGQSGFALASELVAAVGGLDDVDVVIAPPFTVLAAIGTETENTRVELAAQNAHAKLEGAFTGEISCGMLVEAGCKWVILGHSERRQLFGDTNDGVREKVQAAMAAGLRPIVCIGETLAQREAGETMEVVLGQLDAVTDLISVKAGTAAVAYEPVWAIGTGRVAGPEQAQEVHAAIRGRLAEHKASLGAQTRILYGGSVKPENAAGLLECEDIDGALVGGASLKVDSFVKIVQIAREGAERSSAN